PNFFFVGAPKSGTSSMVKYLGDHPDVFMGLKEMHFFGQDLKFHRPFYRHRLHEYLAEFESCNGQHRVGEASVWYLSSCTAAREISEFTSDARILIMLRNPVDMLYSLFCELRYLGDERLPTLREALAAQSDFSGAKPLECQTFFVQGLRYRDAVRY